MLIVLIYGVFCCWPFAESGNGQMTDEAPVVEDSLHDGVSADWSQYLFADQTVPLCREE